MFSAGEVVTCFFLELPKCSQNRAVAHPYSMNSIILFLFCLESLVKMGLAQKKRWARNYKAFRSDLSSTVWWLSGPHMTSIWWLNPVSGVTSENSLVLVVPFFAVSWQEAKPHSGSLPASLPSLLQQLSEHPSPLIWQVPGQCEVWIPIFCADTLGCTHPSTRAAFISVGWSGSVWRGAACSVVLLTQVFQEYN